MTVFSPTSAVRVRSLRVLLVITLSELGGAQKYMYQLAVGLKDRGHEVTVACGPGGPLVTDLRAQDIEVIELLHLVRELSPLRDVRALLSIVALIRQDRPDVVHSTSTKAGLLARVAAWMMRVPVNLFTANGIIINEPMSAAQRSFFSALERFVGAISDGIITVSRYDEETIVAAGIAPRHKITTIHNAISLEDYGRLQAPPVDLPWVLPAHDYLIGTIANFYPPKGLPVLIEAAAQVVTALPGAHFLIVGDGTMRPELESLVSKLGLDKHISLPGRHRCASSSLRAMDVFVLPSNKEGLPYALLEAMAAERPIVATAVGGIPEVIEDGISGMLVPPNDPSAMAEAIVAVLQSPALASRLAAAAHQRVYPDFLATKNIDDTIRVYQSVLGHVRNKDGKTL